MNRKTDIILEVKGIEKNFPGVKALRDVSMKFYKGEIHAICGENGAGKSTLMHILAGVFKQDAGDILINGEKVDIQSQHHANELGISIVYQERSLVTGISVAENIFAGRMPVKKFGQIDWKKLYSMTEELLSSLDCNINARTLVEELSPPQQQMVEVAKALSVNAKILILDEPTATITINEVESLFNVLRQLKKRGISIIYISHRLSEIFSVTDFVSVLKDGCYMGTEKVENIDQDWIVQKMVGRKIFINRMERDISGERILEVRNFTSPGEKAFKDVSFYLNKGEILGFAGLAGAGRTELCRAIFGADPKKSGELLINGKAVRIRNVMSAIKHKIGYMPEDRKEQGLFLEMAVKDNIASASLKSFTKGSLYNKKKVEQVAEEYRKKINIVTPGVERNVVFLSGGNQQKVVLAKWLNVKPEILIVDEPTRGVDVGAKSEIYALMRDMAEGGTSIIMVSSDLPEVLAMSDRIYIMYAGAIRGEMRGSEATEESVIELASGIGSRKESF